MLWKINEEISLNRKLFVAVWKTKRLFEEQISRICFFSVLKVFLKITFFTNQDKFEVKFHLSDHNSKILPKSQIFRRENRWLENGKMYGRLQNKTYIADIQRLHVNLSVKGKIWCGIFWQNRSSFRPKYYENVFKEFIWMQELYVPLWSVVYL